jgi:hypothetical protein
MLTILFLCARNRSGRSLFGVTSVAPQSVSGSSAVNGAAVDTQGYDNAKLYFYAAAASGAERLRWLYRPLLHFASGKVVTSAAKAKSRGDCHTG